MRVSIDAGDDGSPTCRHLDCGWSWRGCRVVVVVASMLILLIKISTLYLDGPALRLGGCISLDVLEKRKLHFIDARTSQIPRNPQTHLVNPVSVDSSDVGSKIPPPLIVVDRSPDGQRSLTSES